MNQTLKQDNSPWVSLFILLGFTLFFTFAVQLIVVGIDYLIYGDLQGMIQSDTDNGLSRPFSIYSLLAAGTIGTFLLPSLVLQSRERSLDYFPQRERRDWLVYSIILFFLIAFSPIMQLIGEWNAKLTLPTSLAPLEQWMKEKEEGMAVLTANIVMTDRIPFLLINIVVMAILPAIGEELFFRGSLMHIVQRLVRNHHVSIWITAIVFSAIHLQFYGFFPRMLLGVMFGYMLVLTNNIWVPIVGHFINNATVTIFAYYYATQGKTYEDLQRAESYSILVYVGSALTAFLVGYWFYTYTRTRKKIYGERLG